MATRIRCPKCQAVSAVEITPGQTVTCPSCGKTLTVRARPAPAEGIAPMQPVTTDAVQPAAPKPRRQEVVSAPPPPPLPRRQEQPTAARKATGAEPPPVPQPRKGTPVWVWGAAAGALVVVLVAVLIFALTGDKPIQEVAKAPAKPAVVPETVQQPEPVAPVAQNVPLAEPASQEVVDNTQKKPPELLPQPTPGPVPQQAAQIPDGAAPPTIQPDSVKRVKKATVQLKVKMSDGGAAEGSGFFAIEPGVVLTNAHVVGMLRASAKPPLKIEVVAHSGQAEEFTMSGKVVGVDRDNDLAAVRVEGEKARWPPPLPVEFDMSNLTELQKVYVFGFPLGSNLGKEITASDSSISSFRRGADGSLFQIQVNGGIQPGNSGGPVVDTRGVVVGVAVALISGTQINFVVPGEKVLGIVNGRVQDTRLGHPYREGEQIKLPVRFACLDPLGRIRAVEVDIWKGPAGKQRPGSSRLPRRWPAMGKSERLPWRIKMGPPRWTSSCPPSPCRRARCIGFSQYSSISRP